MIYFHGNAEDIHICSEFVRHLSRSLTLHCLIVEYPSYGIYKNCKPTEKRIFADAITAYNFAVEVLRFQPENLFIFGRSIGTGPATYLTSQKPCAGLFLLSPYLSIKDIV